MTSTFSLRISPVTFNVTPVRFAGIAPCEECDFSSGLKPAGSRKGCNNQRAFCSLSAAALQPANVPGHRWSRSIRAVALREREARTNGCEAVRKGSPCHSGRYQCGSGSPDESTEWSNAPGDKPNPEADCGCYAPPRDTADAPIGEILNGAVVRNWRRCPRRAKGHSLVGGVPNATFENRHTPSPILSSFQPHSHPSPGLLCPAPTRNPPQFIPEAASLLVRARLYWYLVQLQWSSNLK